MLNFIKQAITKPNEIGAIAASSTFLAKSLATSVDFSKAESIIEFGSGTGVFTEYILNDKHDDATFFSIEINPSLVEHARERCPEAIIYNDSVTNVKKYLDLHEIKQCDHIISGLPWGAFKSELQNDIIDHTLDILKPRGTMLTFTYKGSQVIPAARRFRKLLDKRFSEVSITQTVWRNLPPAYFYKCVK